MNDGPQRRITPADIPHSKKTSSGGNERGGKARHGASHARGKRKPEDDKAHPQNNAQTIRAEGPLGSQLEVASYKWNPKDDKSPVVPYLRFPGRTVSNSGLSTANALIILRQAVFLTGEDAPTLSQEAEQAVLRWAQTRRDSIDGAHSLGQDPKLLGPAARRRSHALKQLEKKGQYVLRLEMEPEWRVVVGLGERSNPHEIGMSLHGTYGWPYLPGTGLKGVAAAYARATGEAESNDRSYRDVFGSASGSAADPRGGAVGGVRFLDALPNVHKNKKGVRVEVDVVTPHEKPYYDTTLAVDGQNRTELPGEHHQPVPLAFLSIKGGSFLADLVGTKDLVEQAEPWLRGGVEELGIGAKTASGYGYMQVNRGNA